MSKIEELEKELAAFHQRMKDELAELRAEQNEQEKQPAEWPQVGNEYWAGATGDSYEAWSATYKGDGVDCFLKAIGDMHRTKEEAEEYRAYRMDPRTVMRDRIQMFVGEYNGGEPGRYEIDDRGCTIQQGIFGVANPFAMKDQVGVDLLLEEFGRANILWACGGPEPGGE